MDTIVRPKFVICWRNFVQPGKEEGKSTYTSESFTFV